MYEGINLEKLAKTVKCCNVKTVNVVTPNFGWFVSYCNTLKSQEKPESILMKVSDIVVYIMKIMWCDLKRILSSRFRDNTEKR